MFFNLNETTHFDQNSIILTKQWQKKKIRRLIVWYCSSSSTFGQKKLLG
jgi:hypothetical protein